MDDKLGEYVGLIELKSGLFGKKPKGIDVYTNGLSIEYKNEKEVYLFDQIARIETSDYFAPNVMNYHFEIFSTSGEKVCVITIPSIQMNDATMLLETHKKALLGNNFPEHLSEQSYILDNYLSWEKGQLVYTSNKGSEIYSVQEIDQFVTKNGSNFFTFKNNKKTLMVSLYHSANCLAVTEICRAIADVNYGL